MGTKGKNIGEWSEMYIFLKLISDKKVYVADKDMNKLKDAFLQIISIIREETKGKVYKYYTGDTVKITLNDTEVPPLLKNKVFHDNKNKVWNLIKNSKNQTTFTDNDIRSFLQSIYINNISAPAQKRSDYFGGTEDIVLDTMDYRTGINQIMGFSCKSDIDSASTLFNASGDNTNFIFELEGNISDEIMDKFNNIYKIVKKGEEEKKEVATGERMEYLKQNNISVKYFNTTKEITRQNLIRCGGMEMPAIVAGILKYFYYECSGSTKLASVNNTIKYITDNDIAGYGFDDLYSTYYSKISNLLYCMFTGLRFSKPWNGRSSVNGGYIVAKRDGDVVAFHSCIVDGFKDFLVYKLRLESPSCKRHNYMKIYKENDKYYIKFALQFRFILKQDSN